MTNKKSRLFLSFIGFFIFITPIIFFCVSLDKEYSFEKERIQEDLKEKLIDSANKIEENLDCYNYLKSEINNIHAELLPNTPQEVVEQILDDSYSKTLYTNETLNKLLKKTKDRFTPIMVTLGTENFENIYFYYNPQLEEALNKYKEEGIDLNKSREVLLNAKSFFDMEIVNDKYTYFFNKDLPGEKIIRFDAIKQYLKNIDKGNGLLLESCYKYISRFCCYNRSFGPFYTDYFSKQKLYSIIKYTISPKGIHGFYTLLIPQSIVDPNLIIDYAKSKHIQNVNISLKDKIDSTDITKTDTGFEYRLNFPSNIKKHIEVYKKLRGIDRTSRLNQQFVFSIDFPKEFILFKKVNMISKALGCITAFLYILIVILFHNKYYKINFNLTKKIIFILSIIMLVPIIGIGILTLLLSHNLSDFIDINVSKNLHNSLENYSLINNEIRTRQFASNLELKKRIYTSNIHFVNKETDSLIDFFAAQDSKEYKEILKWFSNFNSEFYISLENGENYSLDIMDGKMYLKILNQDIRKISLLLLKKYMGNLGLIKSTMNDDENELSSKEKGQEIFSLSLLEQFVNPKYEEKYVPQESIPNDDLITFSKFDKGSFIYSKDLSSKNYYIYSRSNGNNNRPYKILNNYTITNPLWYQPRYKYAYDTELAITSYSDASSKEDIRIQIPNSSIHSKINNLINKIMNLSDSGYEKIKDENQDTTTFNEYIFSNNSAFIIAGTAKSNYKNNLSLTVNLIFPFLMAYAILLLILLSNLISAFINTPIKIYQEALNKLENNHFGTKIDSFSNDEFNSITTAFNEMSAAIKQKEQIKRYVSERLIQSVDSNQIQEAGDGKLEKVTVLSSDIRNFTGISEEYEPSIIVDMLNSYFTRMQQAISNNSGIIDKYIGDAIQAVFYEEPGKENQVLRAVKTALEMRETLKTFNKERKDNGLFTIENGIGIDTDFAITGTIGTSEGRKDFSVNGEVIDRAAELEGKTKETESKILISKKSIEELDGLVYRDFDEEAVELINVRK